jgi:hypothetical protein
MDELNISNVSQYLEIIDELQKTYPSGPILDSPVVRKLLFRGISNESYKLIPSVYRIDILDKNKYGNFDITNDKYTAWSSELNILEDFKLNACCYIKDNPINDLHKWAEYAQHYGVPTRILDWTSNPLVALYFACKNEKDVDASVWMLHLINYKRFLYLKTSNNQTEESKKNLSMRDTINALLKEEEIIEYPIIYIPYYFDIRMSAQSSYFMVWGKNKNALEDMIPLEKYMIYKKFDNGVRTYGKNQVEHILFKVIICSDLKQSFIRQLDMLGINEKTLFPGLDGLGHYIENKYRFDYGETF